MGARGYSTSTGRAYIFYNDGVYPSDAASADIIITGVGKKNILTAPMVKKGVVVIDAGITFADKKIGGDVDFAGVAKKAGLITPVPGGVGPITVAKLLENTIISAENLCTNCL